MLVLRPANVQQATVRSAPCPRVRSIPSLPARLGGARPYRTASCKPYGAGTRIAAIQKPSGASTVVTRFAEAPAPPPAFPIKTLAAMVATSTAACLLAAAGGVLINEYSTEPCLAQNGCGHIPLFMKVPLIATHLLTFALVPSTMWVFHTRANSLKSAGAQDPLMAIIGLSFLMVSIAGEIVTQDWFYREDYSILNCFFYIFLTLGTALWALGIKENDTTTDVDERVDMALLASPALAGIAYLLGAAVTHTKVPIYIILSFEYAALTWRFWQLLKTPKVLLFPFFSVGVNLFCISRLNASIDDPILNPLFHILHDAAGTEMGVAIIAVLVYLELGAQAVLDPPPTNSQ